MFESFKKRYSLSYVKTQLEAGATPLHILFNVFCGRCTFFAIVFTIVGIWGFIKHYDLTAYAMFVGAIFTGLVAHSAKEDWLQNQQAQQQSTQVVNNITVDPNAPVPPKV